MDGMIGRSLGPYRILERLGRGGMATVYKAYQPSLDRYVAVKLLPAQVTDEPSFALRFKREARAVAKLEHPHILAVYDYGQEGDSAYIVMRYIEGGTLKDLLGKPLEFSRIVQLINQIAEALDYAHENGVVHRDVKPSNVLLDRGDWALLSDFGVAHMVEATQQITAPGVGIGTPTYMSPEQGQGKKADRRSDVYSLGVILYEMLTSRVPYEADTPLAVVWKHVNEPLLLPRTISPDIPEPVERVVLKAMAKPAGDRYGKAGELARALREAVQGAEAGGLVPRVAGKAMTQDVIVEEPRRVRGLERLRRLWWVAPAVLSIAVGWVLLTGTPLWQEIASPTAVSLPETVQPTSAPSLPALAIQMPSPTLTSAPAEPTVEEKTTGVSTPAMNARAFAEPILAAIADRSPDYEDDFSDPGSGWPIGSTAAGDAWGYEDGAFFISLTHLYLDADGDNSIGFRSDRAPWFSDFVMEVDGQFISGEWGRWDVGFRQSQSGDSSYWMDSYPNGAFELHKTYDGGAIAFVQGQDVPGFEQGFGSTNRLTIVAQGPYIAVYMNGKPLLLAYDFAFDEMLSSGMILLGVGNSADATLRVRFDNLKVWDITDLPLRTSVP